MLQEERKYQFRERLSVVHPRNIRDRSLEKSTDELALPDSLLLSIPADAGDVLLTGARDFCDYLFDSIKSTRTDK